VRHLSVDSSSGPALLARRLRDDPGSPLITFYDDATGERVELSAVTFDNWVAKTANLIVDGLGFGRGDTAAVVLPPHWQTLVVIAGCWAAGLGVTTTPAGDEAVLFGAEGWPVGGPPAGGSADTVLLSLRPLGGGLVAPPGPGTLDYAADVRTYGDRFAGPPVSPAAVAIDGISHAELVRRAESEPVGRVLIAYDEDGAVTADDVVRTYLGPLRGGGSVLCRHADRAAIGRRLDQERAVIHSGL